MRWRPAARPARLSAARTVGGARRAGAHRVGSHAEAAEEALHGLLRREALSTEEERVLDKVRNTLLVLLLVHRPHVHLEVHVEAPLGLRVWHDAVPKPIGEHTCRELRVQRQRLARGGRGAGCNVARRGVCRHAAEAEHTRATLAGPRAEQRRRRRNPLRGERGGRRRRQARQGRRARERRGRAEMQLRGGGCEGQRRRRRGRGEGQGRRRVQEEQSCGRQLRNTRGGRSRQWKGAARLPPRAGCGWAPNKEWGFRGKPSPGEPNPDGLGSGGRALRGVANWAIKMVTEANLVRKSSSPGGLAQPLNSLPKGAVAAPANQTQIQQRVDPRTGSSSAFVKPSARKPTRHIPWLIVLHALRCEHCVPSARPGLLTRIPGVS